MHLTAAQTDGQLSLPIALCRTHCAALFITSNVVASIDGTENTVLKQYYELSKSLIPSKIIIPVVREMNFFKISSIKVLLTPLSGHGVGGVARLGN